MVTYLPVILFFNGLIIICIDKGELAGEFALEALDL
jgi:hypothetical protein